MVSLCYQGLLNSASYCFLPYKVINFALAWLDLFLLEALLERVVHKLLKAAFLIECQPLAHASEVDGRKDYLLNLYRFGLLT